MGFLRAVFGKVPLVRRLFKPIPVSTPVDTTSPAGVAKKKATKKAAKAAAKELDREQKRLLSEYIEEMKEYKMVENVKKFLKTQFVTPFENAVDNQNTRFDFRQMSNVRERFINELNAAERELVGRVNRVTRVQESEAKRAIAALQQTGLLVKKDLDAIETQEAAILAAHEEIKKTFVKMKDVVLGNTIVRCFKILHLCLGSFIYHNEGPMKDPLKKIFEGDGQTIRAYDNTTLQMTKADIESMATQIISYVYNVLIKVDLAAVEKQEVKINTALRSLLVVFKKYQKDLSYLKVWGRLEEEIPKEEENPKAAATS